MSVTIILIILTAVISWYAFSNHDLMNKWIFYPYTVNRDNSWYRFITSGFLHADFTHLFFNMFTLIFFGRNVEYTFMATFGETPGILIFLLIYIGGIIVSDIPTYIKHRHNPGYRALGASGGVASVVFSSILFYPTNDICLYAVLCIPGFILGVLYLIYSYYSGKRMGDNINHDAHFYGALYGVVITLAFVPQAGPYFIDQIAGWRLPF
ncbi:rhomboid family intramembrane serine protease [Pontibacter burrus]|uniref:Rhomboid family intramembrane serine protease n=1 Tax=Pontibacter burrus TaxID=2704466 RepID=A0A6B3LMR0_9BACT|nr:rhomboid family intramembrane serine protease [Pontibacter burrus]NEM96355.1 rhomboid family intramembrane serine protease [Pontibacter burrus]